MLSNPLGNVLGKPPLSFLPLDPIGSDLPEKFSTPSLRSSRSLLDSRSSSPSDSDTSGFSSGSDHLSDLIVSLGPGVLLLLVWFFWGEGMGWWEHRIAEWSCQLEACLLRNGRQCWEELLCTHWHSPGFGRKAADTLFQHKPAIASHFLLLS